MTWRAAVSAQVTVAWQLSESPGVVVALECQNVTYPAELETNQALYQLHPQSEPKESFSAHLHPRDGTPRVHKPATGGAWLQTSETTIANTRRDFGCKRTENDEIQSQKP